jgi:DNA replication protein DnaC
MKRIAGKGVTVVYSSDEYRDREQIRDEVVGKCEVCKGEGRVSVKDELELCPCMVVFDWICELKDAGIPDEYWPLRLKDLSVKRSLRDQVEQYCEHLDNAVKGGLGFLFLGPLGLGKTSMMSCIGKAGLVQGRKVVYTTVQKYIDSVQTFKDDNPFVARVKEADVLLLDEIDKVYVREGSDWVRKRLEELLRTSIPYHRAVVMATNWDEEDLAGIFGDSVMSLLRGHLKFCNMDGEDYRTKLADRWEERLTDAKQTNYRHPVIIAEAKTYGDARAERAKKQYDEAW